MEKIFVSPGMYLQGENILIYRFGELLKFGKNGFVVTDAFVYELLGKDIIYGLKQAGCQIKVWLVDKEDVADLPAETDFVLSIGGERAIDLGKSLALREQISCVVLPTSAATDAPVSRISVSYDKDGYF